MGAWLIGLVNLVATAEAMAERGGPGARDNPLVQRVAIVTLACLCLIAGIWIMYEGRELVFFYDEWDWLLKRRDGLDGLFTPHNGHFSLIPVLVYKLLLATVGVEPYWVYRLVGVLIHLLCVGLLFALVRRRLGPGLALAAATVLLALGSAWQVLLWPFEISYLFSVAAGIGALLALDGRTRRGDAAAAVFVLFALASSGLGLAVAAGVLVELLTAPPRRRVWVALVPLAVYAGWYVAVSPTSDAKRGNIDAIPGYVADAAAGGVGAVTGLGVEWGRPVLVLVLIVVMLRLVAPVTLPARLIGVATMGLVYWGLLALTRADLNEPLSSRYLYFSAVIVVLVVAEVAQRDALPTRAWSLLALAVGASVLANLGDLRDGANGLRGTANSLRAALAATELAGSAVPVTGTPEPTAAPQVTVGPYQELVADLGSPIGGPASVLNDRPETAVAVDAALARVLGLGVVPDDGGGGGEPPAVVGAINGRTRNAGSCFSYTAAGPGAALDLMLNAGSSISVRALNAAAELRLRRMAAAFSTGPFSTVAAGGVVRLAAPRDGIGQPWVLRVSTSGSVRACS